MDSLEVLTKIFIHNFLHDLWKGNVSYFVSGLLFCRASEIYGREKILRLEIDLNAYNEEDSSKGTQGLAGGVEW